MSQEVTSKLSKLFSVKFWVTVWSMFMISFIVIAGKEDFMMISELLCAVPLAYLGLNVYQKKLLSQTDKEKEE